MRMQQSVKELLYNLPIRVHFAGFESDTLALGQAGWDMSMEQYYSDVYGVPQMRLAMRHGTRESGLYSISDPVVVRDFYGAVQEGSSGFRTLVRELVFNMIVMSSDIQFRRERSPRMPLMRDMFNPVSVMPEDRVVETESIRDFKFFKSFTPSVKDLIVEPEQVHELLDKILKIQAPEQKAIRERERSRQNYEQYVTGAMFEKKPAHIVQAQIISLTA